MSRMRVTLGSATLLLCLAGVLYFAFVKDRVHELAGKPEDAPNLFAKWVDIYSSTSVPSDALKARGVTLAQQRRSALLKMMEKDPAAALKFGVPASVQSKLPSEVQVHLESWKSGYATIEVLAAYNYDNETTYHHHIAFTDGAKFAGFVYGRRYAVPIKESIPLWGMVFDDNIIVHCDSVRPMSEDEASTHDMPVGNEDMIDPVTSARASRSIAGEVGGVVYYFADHASRTKFASRQAVEERKMSLRVQTSKTKGTALSVIVLIVKFTDESSAVTSQASFATYFSHIRKFWVENSYYCSDMNAYFTPVIALSKSRSAYGGSSCPISASAGTGSAMDVETWALATAMGYSQSNYDRYVIVFSSFTTCTWLGLASVASSAAWINGAVNPTDDWHVYAHEMGHNYGLRHANSWVTSSGGAPDNGNAGHSNSYYDDYDIMGGTAIVADLTNFHTNNNKKYDLLWITAAELYTSLTTDCTSQVCNYRIYAQDRPDSIPSRALRVQKTSTRWYWVEVRQMMDYAPAAFYWANGVTIHQIDDTATYDDESNLLDMTAAYVDDNPWSTALENAPLQLGALFKDTTINLALTPTYRGTTNRGIAYMDVAVTRSLSVSSISAPGGISAGCGTVGVGNSVLFTVVATHSAGRMMNYFWQFGDQLFSDSNSPIVAHSYQLQGTYSVNVTISDAQGTTQLITATTVTVDGSSCPCSASCGGKGTCAGATCKCFLNSTGTLCGTELKVASVTPSSSSSYAPTAITVMSTTSVFSAGNQPLCAFRPHAVVQGTFVSATSITCTPPSINYSPYNQNSAKWNVEVEVSPNGGRDWSQSRVIFTYGSPGTCAGCGTLGSTCDVATSTCICAAGYTGTACTTAMSIATITPNYGGYLGGTPIQITGSGIFSTGCNDVLVRFAGASFTAYATGMVNAAGSAISLTTPAATAAMAVTVDVSPNRGVDWTAVTSANFNYLGMTQLYDGLTYSAQSAAASSLNFYQYFHGDESVALTFTLTATSGAAPELYIGKGRQPVATGTACVASLYQDCATLSKTYVAGTAYVGLYYIAVGGAGLAQSTYSILVKSGTASSPMKLTPDAAAPANGYLTTASATDVYTLTQDGDLKATQLTVTAGSSPFYTSPITLTMGYKLNGGSGLTPATSDQQGTQLVLQSCASSGTYNVAVKGPGVYFLKASKLATQSAYQPLSLVSSLSTITVTWLDAIPVTGTSASDFTYSVYYKEGGSLSDMNTPCKVESATKAGDVSPGGTKTVTISGLAPITAYIVNVVVTDKRGVKAVYTAANVSTNPSEVPTSTLIIIGAVVGGVVVLAIILLLLYRCCRKRHKKHHPKKQVQLLTVKGKAKANFKSAAKGELSFAKDEMLVLIGHPTKQGWILARNKQREQGLVPFGYFRVPKEEAEKYLHHKEGDGVRHHHGGKSAKVRRSKQPERAGTKSSRKQKRKVRRRRDAQATKHHDRVAPDGEDYTNTQRPTGTYSLSGGRSGGVSSPADTGSPYSGSEGGGSYELSASASGSGGSGSYGGGGGSGSYGGGGGGGGGGYSDY